MGGIDVVGPRGSPVAAGLSVVAGLSVAPAVSAGATDEPNPAATPRIIIDSDLSRWWDDATAIGMANVLQQRGRIGILGIMSDIRNPVAVAAIDAIDTAYGHPHIPVGAVADSSADTAPHGYSNALVDKLPHSVRSSRDAPGAVGLYRHLLASQPNHSVTIVAIGAYTNLAGLLRSSSGQGSPVGWACPGPSEGQAAGDRGWPVSQWGPRRDQPETGPRLGERGRQLVPTGRRQSHGSMVSPASRRRWEEGSVRR